MVDCMPRVQRPLDVKVQAQNLQGKRFTLTLKGWKARIFQHEYDHLEVSSSLALTDRKARFSN
jgi:peptide deformylase